ncbi:patatin-like phospholipase family protein [Gemmata massiliana]|uniref:patatin-like phospholipase family protein n=1 Tax=Gemmata massiliana TaxID=1210884 RepID=UPI0018D6D426|nr:patatin-like phospholipase family protein [Gemmata massiliana]
MLDEHAPAAKNFELYPAYTDSVATVLWYELLRVYERRAAVLGGKYQRESDALPENLGAVRTEAHQMDLFGVAFSGGGIRSATFNLGILQALGSLELLERIDYLSTVSGGGYVGGWLAAWIRREIEAVPEKDENREVPEQEAGKRGVQNVQYQLDPSRQTEAQARRQFTESNPRRPNEPRNQDRSVRKVVDEEPEPVRHLRSYSRFLTPRAGLFSLDSWALGAVYVRNSVMNLLTILPMVLAAILLLRLFVEPFHFNPTPSSPVAEAARTVIGYSIGVLILITTLHYWLAARGVFLRLVCYTAGLALVGGVYIAFAARQQWSWMLVVLAPLIIAYCLVGAYLRGVRVEGGPREGESVSDPLPPGSGHGWRLLFVGLLLLSAGVALHVFGRDPARPGSSRIMGLPANGGQKGGPARFFWIAVPLLAGAAAAVALSFRAVDVHRRQLGAWLLKKWQLIRPLVIFRKRETKGVHQQRHDQIPDANGATAVVSPRITWAIENNFWEMWLALVYAPMCGLAVAALILPFLYHSYGFGELGPWGRAAALYAIVALIGAAVNHLIEAGRGTFWFVRAVWQTLAAGVYGVALGAMVWTLIAVLNFGDKLAYDPIAVVVCGPPLYLLAIVFAGYTEVALNGTYMREPEREWRSRLGGYLMIWAAVWFGGTATVFYLPDVLLSIPWAATGTWIAGAAASYFTRRAPAEKSPGAGGKALQLLALVAPAIVLIGLIGALSLGVGQGWRTMNP